MSDAPRNVKRAFWLLALVVCINLYAIAFAGRPVSKLATSIFWLMLDAALLYAIAQRWRFARWLGIISQILGAMPGLFLFAVLPATVNPGVLPLRVYGGLAIATVLHISVAFLLFSRESKDYLNPSRA
jgi:hypothetical protein